MKSVPQIAPCLWFDGDAEDAVRFYMSIFAQSRVLKEMRNPIEWPGGKAGDIVLIEFELAGRPYQALNGGPNVSFNDSVSLSVTCRDQAEVDRYWDALTGNGGAEIMCGWLKDKFGLRWQIVPQAFFDLMRDGNAMQQRRVTEAMLGMIKLDVDGLKAAYREG